MASYVSFQNTGTSSLRHRLSFTVTVWTSFLLHIFDAFLPSSTSSDFWVLICQLLALVHYASDQGPVLLTQQLSFYLPFLALALCVLWFPGLCKQNLYHLCEACALRSSETWDFVSVCAPSFVWFLPLFKTSLWVCPFIISCLDNGHFPPMFNCNCG